MPGTGEGKERRRETGLAATVNEAAFVTGVSTRAVNQAIDRGEIRTRELRRTTDPAGRGLGGPELVYLRVREPLSSHARRTVYRQLAGLGMESIPSVIEVEGAVKLDIREPVDEIRAAIQELQRIRSRVEVNPAIRGGEPVFAGTRIPVHMIARFLAQGVSRAEILEDYPALDEEALEVAPRYAVLYPPRGRPKQAPWRSRKPKHVFSAGELDG
jgi:uncharacterized protein (DUF433 family)